MKQKRDFSMLIGVLAGPPATLLFFVFLFVVIGLTGKADSLPRIFVPEGSEMTETDSHGGFHGEGVRVITARIPKEAIDEFAQQLREKGFAEPPIPQWLQKELRADAETGLAGNITHGLWRFQEDSSQPIRENVENYTAELYDFDTYRYYYIEYDT